MHEARFAHTATLLDNGTVLVTGGLSRNTAEIYDPLTGTWRYTAHPMNAARLAHSAVKLSNGKVLIFGGQADASGTPVGSAELYDPASDSFVLVRSPNGQHAPLGALLLNDGRAMVASGSLPYCGTTPLVPEIYDPGSDTWSQTPTMAVGPDPRVVKVADGSLLAFGGGSCPPYATVSRYNPATNTVSQMSPMLVPRLEHTITVLGNGKILVAAGSDPSFVTNSTEIYDPLAAPAGQSQYAGPLTDARRTHTATLLPNGDVLVTGGTQTGNGYGYVRTLASSELFNHVTLAWSQAGAMSVSRTNHTATLLPSGAVLIVGGLADNSYVTQLNSAEIWAGAASTGTITISANLSAATLSISPVPSTTGSQN
jgi:Galactose oxidase, central domain